MSIGDLRIDLANQLVASDRPINGANGPLVRKLDFTMADALAAKADQSFDDELVEGFIGRGALAVLYGDSNSGKTFAAIDIGAAVSRGIQWLGRPTVQGLVLYLASEAPGSVQMRLQAYQRRFGVQLPALVVVRSPINFFDADADVTAVLALTEELESQFGQKVALIIGDTLARLSTGANENSGEDMGIVLRNIDALRSATGAAFLLVHHTGKDAAKGMRGWSGLRAAIDTEVEVTTDERTGHRCLEVTKQRDLPGKGMRIGFKLEPVILGCNRWGNERGSCVVLPSDAPAKPERNKRPSEIAGAVVELLMQHGAGMKKNLVAKHFDGRYSRSAVYRELKKLTEAKRLTETAGLVALLGRTTSGAD